MKRSRQGQVIGAFVLILGVTAIGSWAGTAEAQERTGLAVVETLLAQADGDGYRGNESLLNMQGDVIRAAPFADGTWTFVTYVSGVFGDSDKGEEYTAHVGFGYHFMDDVSFNVEAVGGIVDPAEGKIGGVGALDLLFRWHFVNEANYSIYMDGGAGFQLASEDFPSDSKHNFRPQYGLGGTYELSDNLRLMGGVRWLHISNAGSTEINAGLDGAQFYAGLMWEF